MSENLTNESQYMNNDSLLNELREEGISVSPVFLSGDEIERMGYRKLKPRETEEIAPYLNPLFQEVISRSKDTATASVIREKTPNAYEVIFPQNAVNAILGRSRTEIGANSANAYQDGHSLGPVALRKLEAVGEVPKLAQYAQGLFNAASFFTGQYYLSELSTSISSINNRVDRIRRTLSIEKQSEVVAGLETIQDTLEHAVFIKHSGDRRNRELLKLVDLEVLARRSIKTAKASIESELSSKKATVNSLDEIISSIFENLVLYINSVHLYCLSKIVPTCLGEQYEIDELKLFRDELAKEVSIYRTHFNELNIKIAHFISKSYSEDPVTIMSVVERSGWGTIVTLLGAALKSPATINLGVQRIVHDNAEAERKKKEEEKKLVSSVLKELERLDGQLDLNVHIDRLNKYITSLEPNTVFQVIKKDDDYYVKQVAVQRS